MPLALPLVVLFVVWDNMEASKKASHKSEKRAGSGRGECLQVVEALLSLFPLSRWPRLCPPPAVTQSLHHTLGTWGSTRAPLISVSLLPERQAAAGVSYLAATNFLPSLSLRTKKVKISKDWKVKNVPWHSLGWDNKDKASCNVKQETLFLPRTSHSCKMAWGLLLSYSPRNVVL